MLPFSKLGQFFFETGRDAQRQSDSLFAHKVRDDNGRMLFSLTLGVIMMHYDAIMVLLIRSTPVPKTTEATLVRQNLRLVKQLYPTLAQRDLRHLRDLTRALRLSVAQGEIMCIDGRWYVTHAGLLRIALRARCLGIRTVLQERQSD